MRRAPGRGRVPHELALLLSGFAAAGALSAPAAQLGRASLLHVGRAKSGLPDYTDPALEQAFTPAEGQVFIPPEGLPAGGGTYKVVPLVQITMVYVLLFGPLSGLWLGLHRMGTLKECYSILLPVTLVALLIGFDTANQSLSALARAPNSITAVHALSLWLTMAVWSWISERPRLRVLDWSLLKCWALVMLLFAGYQMMNHLVSYFCSLSERIIFLNLCPVISLVLELLVMPSDRQPQVSPTSKLSLVLMALGAVLFTAEKADFSCFGFIVACAFILVLIPYRVAQRWAVTGVCKAFPLGLLASLDGLALFAPSAIVARSAPNHTSVPFQVVMHNLFNDPSALFLLLLTMATFIGVHLCGLAMMRVGTATSYMVFSNMANFILVALSIVLFKENVAQSFLMVTGLLLSLVSGFWYAIEVHNKEAEAKEAQAKKASMDATKAQDASSGSAAAPPSGSAGDLLARANGG